MGRTYHLHVVIALLMAVVLVGTVASRPLPAAAQTSTISGLGGTALESNSPSVQNINCEQDLGGSFSFQASGTVSGGVYTGPFTSSGRVTLAGWSGSTQPIVDFTSQFAITTADGYQVQGTTSFVAGQSSGNASCTETWLSGFRASTFPRNHRFEATILTPDGLTCTTSGSADVGWLIFNSSMQNDSYMQRFLNDLSAPYATCTGGVVGDTVAPVLTVPGGMTVDATGPGGAVVTYTATATDETDGALTPFCEPASGSTFAIGTTTVTCSVADAAGNSASASFAVTVLGAGAQLDNLITTVATYNLHQGISNSLDSKLSNARSALASADAGDLGGACGKLSAFINEVQAQAGNKLTAEQATDLADRATRLAAVMGC